MKNGISRRNLLRGLGLSAGLAPFLPLLNASGQSTGGAPKRLLLLYSPDGVPAVGWNDWVDWRPQGTETNFTLHEIHSPLDPWKSKMVVPWGLTMSAEGAGEQHAHGMAGCWTASVLKGPSAGADFNGGGGNRTGWGSGPSIDQVVARAFGPDCPYQVAPDDANQETKFRTLELGVNCDEPTSLTRMIYRGEDDPVNPQDNPQQAFETIFDGVVPGGAEPMVDPEAERRRRERLALLDLDRASLNRIRGKVGRLDYDKIDRHLESLLEIEQGLNVTSGERPAACSIPSAPDMSSYATRVRAMLDITASTLACDLTRVMSVQFNRSFSWISHGEWAPGAGNGGHHSYAHDGMDTTFQQIQIDKWYSAQVAYLLGLLDSIPEGDGTVLDNTLVVWGRELGTTAHQFYDYPGLLFGSAGGALQTGRNLNFKDEKHAKLLVSIGQLMGLDMESFGNIDPNSGGLGL